MMLYKTQKTGQNIWLFKLINKNIFIFLLITIILFSGIFSSFVLEQNKAHASVNVYHTSGNQILDGNNSPYIPYGAFLGGILPANANWNSNNTKTYITQQMVQNAHDYWHANTVSLQLAFECLYPNGYAGGVDTNYVSFIDQVISWSNALGMNVSLNLQEESIYGNLHINNASFPANQTMPTINGYRFWQYFANHYKYNPEVFFDLYNEPEFGKSSSDEGGQWVEPTQSGIDNNNFCPINGTGKRNMSYIDPCAYTFWRNGTTQNGIRFYGMQEIASMIRGTGASNLIFVEALAIEDFAVLNNNYTGDCTISVNNCHGKEFLLSASNIVYAVHPYFGFGHNQAGGGAGWDTLWGNLSINDNVPVLASEWVLDNETGSGCETGIGQQTDSVPAFFSYLKNRNIGLIGWALQPGTMIRGWNVTNPTQFNGSGFTCNSHYLDSNPNSYGSGNAMVQYFSNNSVQNNPVTPTIYSPPDPPVSYPTNPTDSLPSSTPLSTSLSTTLSPTLRLNGLPIVSSTQIKSTSPQSKNIALNVKTSGKVDLINGQLPNSSNLIIISSSHMNIEGIGIKGDLIIATIHSNPIILNTRVGSDGKWNIIAFQIPNGQHSLLIEEQNSNNIKVKLFQTALFVNSPNESVMTTVINPTILPTFAATQNNIDTGSNITFVAILSIIFVSIIGIFIYFRYRKL